MEVDWRQLATWQCGLVSRRQLNAAGIDRFKVRNQVTAGRWSTVGPMVVATFTGDLTWEQRTWAGHLHAGPTSLVGGLAGARLSGLTGWDRPRAIEILVPADANVSPLDGVTFTRSRRDLESFRGAGVRSHLAQLEPAILLRAAAGIPERVAGGLVASAVQQRLTSADNLLVWLDRLTPLPRSRLLPQGQRGPVALDGRRVGPARRTRDRTVVRATAIEIRLEPASLINDLRALGVPHLGGRGSESAP